MRNTPSRKSINHMWINPFFIYQGWWSESTTNTSPGSQKRLGLCSLQSLGQKMSQLFSIMKKGKLKAWAIGQIKGSLHKSGHNTIDDKQFTVKEFTGSWGTASATSSWKSKLPKRPVVKYWECYEPGNVGNLDDVGPCVISMLAPLSSIDSLNRSTIGRVT